jgi:two-component system OmpR family sensor kinase
VLDRPAPSPGLASRSEPPTTSSAAHRQTENQPLTHRSPKLTPRTLAGKLIALILTLGMLLITVPGLITYYRVRSELTSRLDQQLLFVGQGAIFGLVNGSAVGPSPQTVWVAQIDSHGNIIDHVTAIGNIRHLNLSVGNTSSILAGNRGPRTMITTDGYSLRIIAESRPGLEGLIVIGLATDSVATTLHRLLILELALASAAALLTALAAYLVSRSFRPLRRLTTAARAMTTELSAGVSHLELRPPLTDTERESEAGQLTHAVNTLLDEVAEQFTARMNSEQRMRQFLADASHELRTPLTSIQGYAELSRLRQSQAGTTGEDDSLARIEAEGRRMARLVEDLLLLARGDQGVPLHASPVELGEVAAEAVELARATFPARTIELSVTADALIQGDRDQLLRVFRNLLGNAVQHTPPMSRIGVSVATAAETAVVYVADEGPGLPEDAANHVFERFWRAEESRVRSRGGSGLGLSIVHMIVTAHHGSIDFQSSVEAGTTVTVRLPLARFATSVPDSGAEFAPQM